MRRLGGSTVAALALAAVCATVLAALVAWPADSPAGASGGQRYASLVESLGAPAASPLERLQTGTAVAAAQARGAAVETAASRQRSRTQFAHLGAARAAQVAGEFFAGQIERQAGGPPSPPPGQRIARFISPHVAQLELPGGKAAVVESTQPMAIETSRGHDVPVDLGLTRVGGVYESVRPVVSALIGRHSSEGASLPDAGLSLTPVNAHGSALGGSEGKVDGASVIYANTQTDTDTAVKPTVGGVEATSILRSAASPTTLYFRVGLPAGARLVQPSAGAGAGAGAGVGAGAGAGLVRIVEGARTVAVVRPPRAADAMGKAVPVSMSATGDLLKVSVSAGGNHQWPIAVDPELATIEDNAFGPEECHHKGEPERISSNWCWHPSGAFKSSWSLGAVKMWNEGTVAAGGYTVMSYHTQGQSKIYQAEAYTAGQATKSVAKVEFAKERSSEVGEVEQPIFKLVENGYKEFGNNTFCPDGKCTPLSGGKGNLVAYKVEALEQLSETYNINFSMQNTNVYIAQEHGPTATFNENEAEIEVQPGVKRLNALYNAQTERGKDPWLGPYANTAFQVKAHDPGIGVAWGKVEFGSFKLEEPIYEEGKCNGVQCEEEYSTAVSYNPSMPEGEPTIQWYAADLAGRIKGCQECRGFTTEGTQIVKVDGRPPSELEVTGWPARNEVSATPHALAVSARDEGPEKKPSSGVKSVAVSIDGGTETAIAGASCSQGPCTASGSYTLAAEALSEGGHRLVVTATDNANNASATEYTFDVRHGTSVPLGPGAVDPTTGQYKLAATDVSLAGAGGVSRVYQSRNLSAGEFGPLGRQWALSLGGGQGLTVLPTRSVVLTSSGGGTTTFRNEKGNFLSPLGDGNVKVEAKEKEAGKGISEYLLKDAHAGTTTVFTQPVGTETTMPQYANQFGQQGASLANPLSDALDAEGNVWVTDYAGDRVLEFSSGGTLLHAYGSPGPYSGNFNNPWGVAVNKSTGNVYVSDPGNSRVVELSSSGSFVRAFGWGVAPGAERKNQLQDCTAYCEAGIAGSGPGQFNWPQGVAIDTSGNVWVAEYFNNRIQEFNSQGEYLAAYGSQGTAGGQFEAPMEIAFSGSNLFVTDWKNSRVQELTSAGAFVEAIGWGVSNGEAKLQVCTSGCRAGIAGAGNGQFNAPWGVGVDAAGDVYVADENNNRVQELSSAGAFITKFGSGGAGNGQFSLPVGLAVASAGEIYVADYNNKRVQEWMRPSWLPTRTEGSLKNVTTAYAYKPVEEEGKVVIEPTEALAATPAGIACVGTHGEVEVQYLKPGCRALTFEYVNGPWLEYTGRLGKVVFHAYNPSSKAMEEKAVAEYSYDKQGRLLAEWDPRVASTEDCGKPCGALKSVYGYDAQGHVTALTAPGQESWGFVYGTIAGDANTGRLLKVTQAPASTKLWAGEVLFNGGAPQLSGTPAVGVRMAVSNGTWTGAPVVYGYQWQDCNPEGKECTPILGATNANYTPVSGDVGHTLVAQVTATNGGGSLLATSAASAVVTSSEMGSYTQTVDSGYSVNAVSCVPGNNTCVVADSAGKALYTTNLSVSSPSTWTSWSGPGVTPSEAVSCPSTSLCLMAAGEKTGFGGNLYYATSLGGAWSSAYAPAYGVDAISCVSTSFCADGQDGAGYFRWSTSPASTSWTLQQQGTASMKAVSCLSAAFCAIVDSAGNVHVATSEAQVKSSAWTQTNVDGTTALDGIACLSSTSCIAVDKAGNELTLKVESSGAASATKHDIDGTTSLSAVACPGNLCAAVDAAGNVFLSSNGGEAWSGVYSFGDDLTAVSCPLTSMCVATDTTGKVTAFNPGGPASAGEAHSPQSGSTIEYRVPLSGGGVPQNLSREEVEKWGQTTDVPAEGTAIFPPDEPQGWPASSYKRATIDYMDEQGRTVNTVSPSGAVATSEYNNANEIVRTLSPANRAAAMAEGCVSVSKKECKSAEVSEKLESHTYYNEEDTHVIRTLGPEHKVKLASGSEAQARAVTHDYYNEGAEEAEEKNNESYNLLTKSVSGALLANGEEKDLRTTTTSYSGQNNLGWKLRKPTSTTADPSGLNLTSGTVYDESTGAVTEAWTPVAQSETGSELKSFFSFGGESSGAGQLEKPVGVATDSAGNVWVADTGHDRVQEFNAKGEFVREFGAEGSGNGAFVEPRGIAVSSAGNVYVADDGNYRVQEFNSTGGFVRAFGGKGTGEGQFDALRAVAVDGEGHVWTIDAGYKLLKDVPRVEEFSAEGVFMKQFGVEGVESGQFKEPKGVAVDSKGNVWVADTGNNRVQEFKPTGEWVRAFGAEGSGNGQFVKPAGLAFDAEGDVWVADTGNNRIQRFTSEGGYLSQDGAIGNNNGQFNKPEGVATDASGNVWIADTANNRVQELTGTEFVLKFGGSGSGSGQLEKPAGVATDSAGNVWVADTGHDRVQEFNAKGEFVREFGAEGSGNGAFIEPRGIAVSSAGNVYVADDGNYRVQEFNSTGGFVRAFGSKGTGEGQFDALKAVAVDGEGHVWTIDAGYKILKDVPRVEEFSAEGVLMKQFGVEGVESGQFKEPKGVAVDSKGNVWVADTANNRVQEFKPTGEWVRAFGAEGSGNGQFVKPTGVAFDAEGDPWVADPGNNRIQRFNSEGGYLSQVGTIGNNNGQFNKPEGVAIEGSGNAVAADTANNRVQVWTPEHRFAHDMHTVYYTPGTESRVTACQNHPEWANLPCRTEPAAQPLDTGNGQPSLPVTTMTYNMWDEVETTTETFGSATRTKTQTYDPAGRAVTSEETATVDTALPKVTNEYNSETGALEKQSATIKGETKTVVSKDNTLGQVVEYADAAGNVTKYTYEEGSDGRLEEIQEGKGKEAESYQTYSYDPTTGFMKTLIDSAAGTFTASYDVEGRLTSEVYPNGMCANTTYDPSGTATSIQYIKTRNCSEGNAPLWFSDAIAPGVHGETLSQASSLASESYAYDNAGRLTEVQETPAGKGCTTRLYGYDEESNRTSLTTREPGLEGKCATTGGTVQQHSYDEANRLVDSGVEYEALGNTTKLPAADAGEHEIKSTYYVDNQVATQEQNKTLVSYVYDPSGRTMESSSENTETKAKTTTVSHYSGAGAAITWTSEGTEKWSRNIPGIDGSLSAVQTSNTAPVLQLHDLQGNIVATASLSEGETKLASTYNSTEFGVPSEGKTPPKYAWLGANGVATETSFGTGVATEEGASYVPQVARSLQTTPVIPPGAFPNGQGTGKQFGSEIPGWYISLSAQESAETLAAWTAKQEQLAREAEEKKCAVASECVESEEGWIDPEKSVLLTTRQATLVATALRQGPEFLEKLAQNKIIGEFTSFIAERLAEIGRAYMKGLAYGLELCYKEINLVNEEARCKIYIDWVEEPVEGKKRTVTWGAEICWGKSYKRKNKVHWTFPYCTPELEK